MHARAPEARCEPDRHGNPRASANLHTCDGRPGHLRQGARLESIPPLAPGSPGTKYIAAGSGKARLASQSVSPAEVLTDELVQGWFERSLPQFSPRYFAIVLSVSQHVTV